ncbi:NF-X1 finger transcription factor [Aspergillus terreus]|uniref:NF-X1 finger transcription factor n=1 Tax=Aspergillus terreus TaxID=33178 RepID=A0A5M3YN98_ASPTE|nr:hypothetical protein ATETN484_0002004200 [Aspergillus terreus]GFF13691.1 NF-X1 finger transcription factor [Aspergillus terreus]
MSPDRTRSSRNGLAALAAETPAIDRSIAACTSARRVAIHKTLNQPIARGPQILYPIALVVRLCWPTSPDTLPGHHARTLSPTVWRFVVKYFPVDTLVIGSATLVPVERVCARALSNLHSASVLAKLDYIVVGTPVESDAVPTPHNCHTDDEACPKCPYLTEKPCLCGKQVLKNQPCWLADARCGRVCGELLKCGSHTCQKDCHRPGECEDASKPCQQSCGKTKTMCGHPCTEPCHAPYPCPEKTPCAATITVTCGCGRLRQQRRCGAAKAVAAKGQVQQPQRAPALTPLTCDDECARLERNRSLASALGIDVNPATTVAQPISSTNLPYSAETLDLYIQLSSTSPLSTLQSYEAAMQGLATSTTQRSVRFQPAKPSLRAFTHSLAADWGFASESFDPEPHRHVFVLKPTSWTPPPFGLGTSSTTPAATMGIGGMSVGECVKLRERHRLKEREAQRVAAAEAKAQREAAKAAMNGSDGGGWAQVAASRKTVNGAGISRTGSPLVAPSPSPLSSGSMYAALAGDTGGSWGGKKEKLVLRSGVGASKQLKMPKEEVADSWEEEEEKEEQREQEQEQEQEHGDTEAEGEPTAPEVEAAAPVQ